MSDARAWLKQIADAIHLQAADAHILGMNLTKRSARIEQLARISSDDEATKMLAILVANQIVRPIEGGYAVCEVSTKPEVREDANIQLTNSNIGKA